MPMTPDQMFDAIAGNLPKKTGKTLEEWVALLRTQGLEKRKERIEWLKREHGLGHGQAQVVVAAAEPKEGPPATPEELLDAQFAGPKAALRPIYERLAKAARALGPGVTLDPRQTYVSLVRKKQFGIVQASTQSRVDLGLVLPDVAPTDRLQPAGSSGSGRTTRRVALSSAGDMDADVLLWLREAYYRAA